MRLGILAIFADNANSLINDYKGGRANCIMKTPPSLERAVGGFFHGLGPAPALLGMPRFGLSQAVAEPAFDEGAGFHCQSDPQYCGFERLWAASEAPAGAHFVGYNRDGSRRRSPPVFF